MKTQMKAIAAKLSPVKWKEFNELRYWKRQKASEGGLSNEHYAYYYTQHFGLSPSYFHGKVMLDIGCGPRGSLEWADGAKRRIGLDPLAKEYLKLGADKHQMEYIDAPSENIPLGDAECDAVFSFNSLDHVEDVEKSISETKRITKPGGIFLLLVEVNHPPTDCEPHTLTPEGILASLRPEFMPEQLAVYQPRGKGMYAAIRENVKISDPESTTEPGYLSALFRRSD